MPSQKKCCASCIGDRGLRKQIFPIYRDQTTIGICSYCKTQEENLIDPAHLRQHFELLVNIYHQDDDGKSLIECFRDDWDMFLHPQMDVSHCKELLADILNDGEIVRKNFVPSNSAQPSRLDSWGKLRDELMYKNRFFPETEIDKGRLEELLSYLILDPSEVPTVWYRARIQEVDKPYEIQEMGAPQNRQVSQGRANPAGIPYLYLASTSDTAISEIRPHTGELVSVAEVTFSKDLKIIDLRNPRNTVSPFILNGEEEVALLRGDVEFLQHLGNELTRPVLPKAAAIDYIPSQYLCEFIKKCGYDGVVYRSAVGEGINLALFLPELAKLGLVKKHKVSKVSVEHEILS